VPPELIEACGFEAHRLAPRADPRAGEGALYAAGVCPFVRAWIAQAPRVDGAAAVVAGSECDQMRRGADILARRAPLPVFLLNVPATWQTEAARRYYRDELRRLAAFLEAAGGVFPSGDALAARMAAAERRRARERAAAAEAASRPAAGVPIALVGGPLLQEDAALFGLVAACGGRVAVNGLDGGERTAPRAFDPRAARRNPIEELADAYFDGVPDAFRRPDDGLHAWIGRALARHGARGLIMVRYVWCDTWHAETGRLRDELRVPVLELDLNDEVPLARYATRVQAFLEMLA